MTGPEIEASFRRIYALTDTASIVAQSLEGEETRSASFLLSERRDTVKDLERRLEQPEAKASAND